MSGTGSPTVAARPVIAIGASTGGTKAIRRVLAAMNRHAPPIVIAQHMPGHFTKAFAASCDAECDVDVREARSGDVLHRGLALVAPGGRHLRVLRHRAGYVVVVESTPPVNRHQPSIDVLFHSVARAAGPSAIGVLLTGMGDDGARGLWAMKLAGATTLVQDEASSVVFGMAREAIALGAADLVLPLADIGPAVLELSVADA